MRIKKLFFIPALLALFITSCDFNSGGGGSADPKHEHTFSEEWSSDDEYHWHDSTCGHDVISGKEQHSYVKIGETQPSFESEGFITYECSVCKHQKNEKNADKLEHNFSEEWEHDGTHHWHKCLDEGYPDVKGSYEEHDYKVEVIQPTYDAKGYTLHTCKVCGYSYKDNETSELEHNFAEGWEHSETHHWHKCLDDGFPDVKGSYEEHDFEEKVYAPDYYKGGYTAHTCKVCGYSFNDTFTDKLNSRDALKFNLINDDTEYEVGTSDKNIIELDIPEKYNGLKVTKIMDYGFQSCNFEEVVIPSFITDIGKAAFDSNPLKKVTIHKDVKTIGVFAFDGTEDITNVYFNAESLLDSTGAGAIFAHTENFHVGKDVTFLPDCYVDRSVKNIFYEGTVDSWAQIKVSSYGPFFAASEYFGTQYYKWNEKTKLFVNNELVEDIAISDDCTYVVENAFEYYSYVKVLTLGKNITSFGEHGAFCNCENLEKVYWNCTEVEYDQHKGWYCCQTESLKELIFGDTVRVIPAGFTNGRGLIYVEVGKNVEECLFQFKYIELLNKSKLESGKIAQSTYNIISDYSERTFKMDEHNFGYVTVAGQKILNRYYGSEKEIVVSDFFDDIGPSAFGLKDIVSIDIQIKNLSTLQENCFIYCSSLKNITLPDSVKSFEKDCFYYCFELDKLNLPAGFNDFGDGFNFASTKELYFEGSADQWVGIKNFPYTANAFKTMYFKGEIVKDVILSDGVKSISNYAFLSCSTLKTISIPSSVSSIGIDAFGGCENLKYNSLDGCKYLGNSSNLYLWLCGAEDSVETIQISNTCRYILRSVFEGNKTIKEVNVPSSVYKISSYAFRNCSNLSKITLNEGLVVIEDGAFELLTIKEISVPDSVTTIGYAAFDRSHIESLYIGLHALDVVLFSGTFIKDTSVGTLTFNAINCGDHVEYPLVGNPVSNIVFGDDVEYIPAYFAYQWVGSDQIQIGKNVTAIGKYAFANTALKTIEISDKVVSIGDFAFGGCDDLESVTIGSGLTSFNKELFYGCPSLKTINIPSNVATLKDSCLAECSSLKTIYLTTGLTTIEANVFACYSDGGLEEIYYDGSKANWASIDKADNWMGSKHNKIVIHCSDGDINID